MRKLLVSLVCGSVLLPLLSVFALEEDEIPRIRSAIVKIKNVSQRPDYASPWLEKDFSLGRGSGVIIPGNRILTSAHVVSDSRYLEVEKEDSGTPYGAVVSHIGHDCDLALLEVLDPEFFADTTHLDFHREIPPLGSMVEAYGFPAGGRRITVTRGVVSRIDYALYNHSARDYHLVVQIDAAVNPGNSGGPALREGKIVGIVFQGVQPSENVGHVIPITVIRHFLEDLTDGRYDGYPDLGIITANLLNPAYREYLGLPEGKTGVAAAAVLEGHSAKGFVLPGDILLAIDGNPILNDGTILIDGESYFLEEVVERKQVGEEVALDLVRDGEEMIIPLLLRSGRETLRTGNEYETRPEYLIFGGLLFQPLSREYLQAWSDDWSSRADPRLPYYFSYYNQDRIYLERPEIVVLSRVLPAPVNQYYSDLSLEVVERVNGVKIRGLADLEEAFARPAGDYHLIEFDGAGPPVVLDAAAAEAEHATILQRYRIPADRHLAGPAKPVPELPESNLMGSRENE
ncbi:MAG: trypsin-like peptidase domain-containing protein [Candidatus Erginobacter occultus]|nr:trypsin-like peptidase domain-containing protein [Candidatus Erginobacter occultus]